MGYIIIDTGTTNTRIRYIEGDSILGEYQSKVGVRNTAIDKSTQKLKDALQEGISQVIEKSNKSLPDVKKIIAYGMITSNLGIFEIPHLQTPVGIEELSTNIRKKMFEEICEKPICFIPGVKNRIGEVTVENFQDMDIMRGEEVEALGALVYASRNQDVIYISPGSHTKFVFIDSEGRIQKCSTTLTGELLWALSKETVLASAIPQTLITSIDEAYIKKGIEAVKQYGFSKACFLVRIMEIFTEATDNQRVNFIAGAICYHDIISIEKDLKERDPYIIIGGKKILRELYGTVLKLMNYDEDKIKLLSDDEVERVSTVAAIKIVEGNHVDK
ncbi:2-dehydro-3-deoxygalactonokinase [Natronincola ferrireducens]|uniref:2-dehydro-3-deoxygalactonokinase n=1 Tax=Natronincola ferrireducens TaxID=393762 RepID=A0A1G8YU87_9FIRM|nr:2-dehydro-3-deoxygalactonokinase [Natronincola ferrireducens]SDK06388.1 2-dehydro-3-deoxygalactonokinase [Natronincola ferrireducens]